MTREKIIGRLATPSRDGETHSNGHPRGWFILSLLHKVETGEALTFREQADLRRWFERRHRIAVVKEKLRLQVEVARENREREDRAWARTYGRW